MNKVKLTVRIDEHLKKDLLLRVAQLKKLGKKVTVQDLVSEGILWRLGQSEPG